MPPRFCPSLLAFKLWVLCLATSHCCRYRTWQLHQVHHREVFTHHHMGKAKPSSDPFAYDVYDLLKVHIVLCKQGELERCF